MQLICPNPNGGPPTVVDMATSGSDSAGNVQSQFPALNARRINLCIQDVQQTIAEGRASGQIKLFNISGATYPGI